MSDTLDLKHEIGRKAIHLTSLVIIFIYIYFGKSIVLSFMTIVLVIFLSVEYFRIEWGFKLPVLDRFLRAHEKHVFGGEIFFMIGAFIAISVFTKEIAITAILMTTFGDMAGALFGKTFGRRRIPKFKNKTIEGSLSEFFVNILLGCIVFIYAAPQGYLHPEIIIMIMASTATIVETVVNKIDDNLLIPIFAGSAGELLLIFFEFIRL